MSIKAEIIDSLSFFLFTLILYFLSVLSKRLGEVMGMKKYYYIYYAGMFFTLSGSIIMILPDLENAKLIGYSFFSIGLTLGLIASIKYWGWVIKELIKG
ncbi:MAG: hypothetical protein FIB08_07315 [Candidatus Methanoperedens sp.]|nr:hypothetical protein [Candidatus Methanoperedens sp.]